MKESNLTRKILQALRNQPQGFWFKVHGHPGQQRGLPDIIGCHQGRFVGLEVKAPGKEHRVTELQSYTLNEIRAAGGIAGVVTSPQEALTLIKTDH